MLGEAGGIGRSEGIVDIFGKPGARPAAVRSDAWRPGGPVTGDSGAQRPSYLGQSESASHEAAKKSESQGIRYLQAHDARASTEVPLGFAGIRAAWHVHDSGAT